MRFAPPLNWPRSEALRPLLARAPFRRTWRASGGERDRRVGRGLALHVSVADPAPHTASRGGALAHVTAPGQRHSRKARRRCNLPPCITHAAAASPTKSSHLTAPPRGPQQSNRDQHAPPAAAPLVAPRDGCKLIAGEAAFRLCPSPTEAGGSSPALARHASRVPRKISAARRGAGGTEAPNRSHELCMNIA